MSRRLVTGVALLALACQAYPTTWAARYLKAQQELAAADGSKQRFYALPDAAKAAFEVGNLDEAREWADELLELAPQFPDDWNYGNAIHDGHMVLGRLALRDGAAEQAEKELLLAGSSPGSPQLNSFGPNMSLARDLLEKGHSDTVIEYYSLCGAFWELEDGRLERWSALAREGVMPDFQANLFY